MVDASFFDIFGFIGFLYILIFSIYLVKSRGAPKWSILLLLIIGILGVVVDGWIVLTNYII